MHLSLHSLILVRVGVRHVRVGVVAVVSVVVHGNDDVAVVVVAAAAGVGAGMEVDAPDKVTVVGEVASLVGGVTYQSYISGGCSLSGRRRYILELQLRGGGGVPL